MALFLRLVSRLPLWLLYGVSDALAWLAIHVVRYRRRVILENLSRSFPEKPPDEIRTLTREFYYNLTDVIVESLKGLTMSESALRKRVVFHDLDLIQHYRDREQSLIFLTTHQCNWEWLLLAGCLYLPYPIDAVYKPLANKKMDDVMYQARARFGGKPISKDRVLREVLRRKDQIRGIALVADQTPASGTPKHWINFLHQATGFYRAIEQLPQAVRCPVVFAKMKRVKRGHYEVSFVPVGDPPYEKGSLTVLPRYAKEAEKMIRQQPAHWLWSHKRWKHAPNDDE